MLKAGQKSITTSMSYKTVTAELLTVFNYDTSTTNQDSENKCF